jgi:hypothetical protein
MTPRRRISIEQRDTIIAVRGWRAGDLAREAGCRPTFSGTAGWLLDTKRLPDLVAYLESRHIPVDITEAVSPDGPDAA